VCKLFFSFPALASGLEAERKHNSNSSADLTTFRNTISCVIQFMALQESYPELMKNVMCIDECPEVTKTNAMLSSMGTKYSCQLGLRILKVLSHSLDSCILLEMQFQFQHALSSILEQDRYYGI
jgi:hypothetical protein